MLWTKRKCPFTFHTADVLCTFICYRHNVHAVLLHDFHRRKKTLCKQSMQQTKSTPAITKKIIE